MAVKVTKPQVNVREEINRALTLEGLKNQTLQVKNFKSDGRLEVGTNPNDYGGYLFVHNDIVADSTTKEELSDNAVLLLQPHATNSTHMAIGQVNNGDAMGIQVTNASKTANWDIALNPFGGNVGIGTNNPGEKLVVYEDDSGFANTTLLIHNNKADDAAVLKLRGERTGTTDVGQIIFDNSNKTIANIRGVTDTTTDNGALQFWTAASGSNAVFRAMFDSNGNFTQGNSGDHSWTAINNTLFSGGGIGTTSNSDWGLQMAGSTTQRIRFFTSNGGSGATVGSITVTASATAYNTSSDYRLKTDLQSMTGSIDRVKALNPINFAWVADGERTDGFLAHEAAEVVPEAVTGIKDAMRDEEYEVTPAVLDDEGNVISKAVKATRSVPDYQGIDQSKLVPLLTSALQEAIDKIESLEQRLNDAGL